MTKPARLIAMSAVVFGMSTAAYAQTSPHLHAPPPATAVEPAPTQPQQKADRQDGCQCSCCQMMQMMEKQSGDAGCMQKMKMMQGRAAQEKPASPQEQEKH